MDFEDTRTPRTLIRYITENKLASIRSKSQRRKRIKSSFKREKLVQPDSESSPTPRTLIKNVLKEKEASNSSVYIPRHRSYLRKSVEKEPTPAFKRRAIERKRSLKSSRIATPEKLQKDCDANQSKNLEISSPLPYALRHPRRRPITVQEFAQGVRQIRHKRELASASSGSNKQYKPGHIATEEESDAEREIFESNKEKKGKMERLANITENVRERNEERSSGIRKHGSSISSKPTELSENVSGTETEVWDSEGFGRPSDRHLAAVDLPLPAITTHIAEKEDGEDLRDDTSRKSAPFHSTELSESVTRTETEVWGSEDFGRPTDRHLAAVDLPLPAINTQIAEKEDGIKERGEDLLDDRRHKDNTFSGTSSEEILASPLPETVLSESDDEKRSLQSSEKRMDHPLSPGTPEHQATKETSSLDLHKEKLTQLEVVSDSERLPPSEDEVPELEANSFHALETLEEEEDVDEEILPIKSKDTDQPKKRVRKKAHAPRLPSSLTKKLFQHYCGMKVSREAVQLVESCCDAYFEQMTDDLLAYSNHAGRKTIEPEDMELLLRRQGFITDERSLYTLVEKYLPLEYRQEIIPMATAHNVIIPKK